MQFKSPTGHTIGHKSKSHMAEFSVNPDSRNKAETSFCDYQKRIKHLEDNIENLRIYVNRERYKKQLEPFLDNVTLNEIIDDCELSGENLLHYLIDYYDEISIDNYIDKSQVSKLKSIHTNALVRTPTSTQVQTTTIKSLDFYIEIKSRYTKGGKRFTQQIKDEIAFELFQKYHYSNHTLYNRLNYVNHIAYSTYIYSIMILPHLATFKNIDDAVQLFERYRSVQKIIYTDHNKSIQVKYGFLKSKHADMLKNVLLETKTRMNIPKDAHIITKENSQRFRKIRSIYSGKLNAGIKKLENAFSSSFHSE